MAGCTAVVALHVGNQLYVANAGERMCAIALCGCTCGCLWFDGYVRLRYCGAFSGVSCQCISRNLLHCNFCRRELYPRSASLTTATLMCSGDSRGVLCRRGGQAYALSYDHKPQQVRLL
jgi:serine/threonine protein phosphatase PrpC